MPLARLEPLVLKPRKHRSSPHERWIATALGIALVAAFAWIGYLLLGNPFRDWAPGDLATALRKLVEQLPAEKQVEGLLLVVATSAHLWYQRRASRYERLYLDHTGIRYASPLPETLRRLKPDWSLQWSHLREIRIAVPKSMLHPALAVLELDAGPAKRKLPALYWEVEAPMGTAAEESADWRKRFFQGLRPARDREEIVRRLEQSPIVRYARQAGVKVTTGEKPGMADGFALERHRHAMVATALVLLLLVYAVLDLALNEEIHAVEPPLALFVVAGAVAALAAMAWLSSTHVPRAETLGLSLLLGGAAGFALYPGALRLNQATDSEGLRAYDYRLTGYVEFTPSDPGLPVLSFPRDADYWRQFTLGTTHRFELRKGGLGFYQVNMQPVHARMREYFLGRQ